MANVRSESKDGSGDRPPKARTQGSPDIAARGGRRQIARFGFADRRCTVILLTVDPSITMPKIHLSTKGTAVTNDHTRDIRTGASTGELTEDQLKKASGGLAIVEHKVVAPRDQVSGNATGRRAYKA